MQCDSVASATRQLTYRRPWKAGPTACSTTPCLSPTAEMAEDASLLF